MLRRIRDSSRSSRCSRRSTSRTSSTRPGAHSRA